MSQFSAYFLVGGSGIEGSRVWISTWMNEVIGVSDLSHSISELEDGPKKNKLGAGGRREKEYQNPEGK